MTFSYRWNPQVTQTKTAYSSKVLSLKVKHIKTLKKHLFSASNKETIKKGTKSYITLIIHRTSAGLKYSGFIKAPQLVSWTWKHCSEFSRTAYKSWESYISILSSVWMTGTFPFTSSHLGFRCSLVFISIKKIFLCSFFRNNNDIIKAI